MSMVKYHIEYSLLSAEERKALIEQIDSVSYTGLAVASDCCSGEFLLGSESELQLIDFPQGCCLTRL